MNKTQQSFRVNTLVIGAGRSGTTSICNMLARHPQVCYSVIKEVNYFSIPDLYRRGTSYLHSFFGECAGKPVVATADTYLMIDYRAIDRIHRYNPDMKLIVMLRDPVDRAYSSYHYSVNYGHHEAYERFTDSIAAEEGIAEEPDVVRRNNVGHFYAGLYARHLEQWFKRFDRNRVFILPTRRLKEDPEAAMAELQEFLGLPNVSIDARRLNVHAVPRSRILERAMLNREGGFRRAVRNLVPWFIKRWIIRSGVVERITRANRKAAPVPEMDPGEREKAIAYFREDNERLKRLVRVDFGSGDPGQPR